ncbi:MAG: hypothetical protein EOP43_06180 [Sphingobacteriaceae bacterium]|nr:MAG: hypothetical protein EOP43_06180 [Sphingobacteriaceae bacterium]
MSFSYKKIRTSNQQEIVFLNLRKNLGVIFKKGNEAIVLTDLNIRDKAFQYSVQPYLDSCRLTKIRILQQNQNFQNTVFIKQNKLIQFQNHIIFVADKEFQNKIFPQKIKVDEVFITDNPKLNLRQITQNLIFDLLVVDSRNSDYLIKKLNEEANLDGRKIKILKRNFSLVVASK